MPNPSFSWKNYNRNTPQLYLRIAKLVKRILYGLSTGSILLTDEKWMSVIVILMIPTVEELVQFFSDASDEANTVKVEMEPNKDNIVMEQPKP